MRIQKLLLVIVAVMLLGISGCSAKDSEGEKVEENNLTIETEEKEDDEAVQFVKDKMLIEDGSIEIQNLSPYSGNDFREGEISKISDVYAVKITNLTNDVIKDASLVFNDGKQELVFSVSYLPAGEATIVIESEQKNGSASNLIYVEGEIEYLTDNENAMNSVTVVFQENRSVQVKNMTEEDISLLWLICKPFNEQDETYGTAYIIAVDSLEGNGEQTIETELSGGDYQIVWAQRKE